MKEIINILPEQIEEERRREKIAATIRAKKLTKDKTITIHPSEQRFIDEQNETNDDNPRYGH